MKKYILTKDFPEIPETYGLIQNLSGDANIEITNNTNEQGILLKPFPKITINPQIYARKLGGGGTAQLMVLPFKNNSENVADDVDSENYYSNESYVDENLNRPRRIKNQHNNFGYPNDWQRSRRKCSRPIIQLPQLSNMIIFIRRFKRLENFQNKTE